MKKILLCLFIACISVSSYGQSSGIIDINWQRWNGVNIPSKGTRHIIPARYSVFAISDNTLKSFLFSLPADRSLAKVIDLPTPDGNLRSYKVWMDNIMEEGLAEKYPNIKTFSGYAADNKGVTIKLDFTEFGFHAMVFDRKGVYFIDPFSDARDGFYQCYFKSDYQRSIGSLMQCNIDNAAMQAEELTGQQAIKLRMNGQVRRDFRLALACTGEYAVAVAGTSPTKAAVLSKMVTSVNRVNGVYEREVSVHLNLIANTDTLIFLDGTTDPYSNGNGSVMLGENKDVIDSLIGPANYDIGHVFSTGGGGVASKASVCKNNKAQGVTGNPNPQGDPFDIDYVSHEMGHQFGADHTFNTNTGSCGGNGVGSSSYEPGSGSTIMAYAGICGADNLQPHSDPYFHARSLEQITNFLTSSTGATCAATTPSNNTPPSVGAFTSTYSIPILTPFELTAPAVADADHDTMTFCWEEWNRGTGNTTWANTTTRGPLFRSFNPDTSATRVFPRLDSLLRGKIAYLGEKLPSVARYLTFKLTVRDVFNGYGTFNFPDDTVHLDVIATTGPFSVTAPVTAANWLGNTAETVTWNVVGTDMAPINCTHVDILLSVDGGYTYPYVLAANTPNDGSETINVPNIASSASARVKIKAVNNVFFNISPTDFVITHNTGVKNVNWQEVLDIFPVPADDVLHLVSLTPATLKVDIINAIGQKVYTGQLEKKLDIPVASWAKGIYYVTLSNTSGGEKVVRPVIVD